MHLSKPYSWEGDRFVLVQFKLLSYTFSYMSLKLNPLSFCTAIIEQTVLKLRWVIMNPFRVLLQHQ